jgi:lipoprotein NlpI
MFKSFCQADLSTITIKQKRALLSELRESIKQDVLLSKTSKIISKQNKEAEKRAKVVLAIKLAEEKLAKLNAKLV